MTGERRPPSHYAVILRAARNALGLRQKQLANLSDVSAPSIARIEKGQNVPRPATWQVLIWVFQKYGIAIEEHNGGDVVIRFNTKDISDFEEERSDDKGRASQKESGLD